MANNNKHSEGPFTKAIESKTTMLPSHVFLCTALSVMGASLALQIMGKRHTGLFVGQWAAPLLIMGLYNKLVKVEGSEGEDEDEDDE